MKVIFLHHSSFLVELEHTILLFDYFNGSRVNGFHFNGTLPQLDSGKTLTVFASHSHQDHFDRDNLKLADRYPNVRFVFSKDCRMSRNYLIKHGFQASVMDRITYVAAGKQYELDGMQIRTLFSTDEGVAYCVTAEGKNIYHAGDLHWWYWEGAGDLINGRMERGFKREIRRIEDVHFDLAFVPLDPRQEQDAFRGIDYFMKHVDADHVFPMHMWQDYSLIQTYKKRISNDAFAGRIVDISRENQEFVFSS